MDTEATYGEDKAGIHLGGQKPRLGRGGPDLDT